MNSLYDASPRIPVVLVTGFLGGGKTTLINRMLENEAYARAAVVVNEFGETSVDHLLIQAPQRRTRVIDGGCLCGHVHEEVAASLVDLLESRGSGSEMMFDRVLIETSGLADPVPIIQILLADSEIVRAFELRSVITVADGVQGLQHLEDHAESMKQAAVADVFVLSKADVVTGSQHDTLAARLAAINPGARQLRADHGNIDFTLLEREGYSAVGRSALAREWLGDARYAAHMPAANADPAIRSFTLSYEREVTLPGFILWMNLLAGFRGAGLLRVKGIVNVEGRPYAVQAVQTVISEPVALERWPDEDRTSRLVFITRGMDPAQVRRTFDSFAFEGAREHRNLVIRPELYARFKDTIGLFRQGPPRQSASERPSSH